MAREEEIRQLAHVIWEREGCPAGKADEHWHRAKQFLENQEVAEAAGEPSLANLSKQSEYHFHFAFAVAMMAIGTTLVLLTPPLIISGLSSVVIGSILSLLSLVLIIESAVEREPRKFHARRIKWALSVMLVGIGIIPAVALVNYYRPGTFPSFLQLVGVAVFILGIYVARFSFSKENKHKKAAT
jgi:uncharacterized membrane protein